MSRILRRPMFRGGKVDSRGTGITTGLDQPRIGARTGRFFGDTGNPFVPKPVTTQGIIDAYTPRGLPQSFIDFFRANQANQRPSGRFRTTGPGVTLNESELAYEEFPQVSSEMPGSNIVASADEGFIPESLKDKSFADVEIGLEETNLNPEKIDNSPKEVKTPKPGDDEPEVTMTDLEKALGLDRARQEYAADALAAASKAFFEGKGFGAIADAAAVKSKAPDIKRIAALEEFKMKGAKDIAQLRKQQKEFAPGNFEKNDKYLQKKYPKMDERERLKILQKKPSTFAEQYIELSKDFGYKNADIFKDAAFLYFGNDYISDVATDGDMTIGEPTPTLSDGIYTDAANELIFVVKDKKVTSRKKF